MARRISDLLAEARAGLRHQPSGVRVRARWAGLTVLDTTAAHLVWEPRRILPEYAVPAGDLRDVALEPTIAATLPQVPASGALGPDVRFGAHTAPGEPLDLVLGKARAELAAYRPDDPDLAGLVLLDFAALDAWWHEDDRIHGHPRDPFHRVDVLASRRTVAVSHGGEVLARSERPVLVHETGFGPRWYLPRADVRVDLAPSDTVTVCPYKGDAAYWSAPGLDDVAWSYDPPLAEVAPIAGHVCFDPGAVEVSVRP